MKHKAKMFWFGLIVTCFAATQNLSLAQGIRESGFSGTALDTFWVFRDPLGGSTLTVSGGQARIDVPSPAAHEPVAIWQGGIRSPRIVQRIAAPGVDHGDFDVYAKFDGSMQAQYQMQGILAIQNDSNYIRCELYSDSDALNYLLFTFDNSGNYGAQIHDSIPGLPRGTTPLWLRLKREGSLFTQYYSTNGVDWTTTVSVNHAMYVDSIGVYVANADSGGFNSNTSPDFTGIVDFFGPVNLVPVQLASFTAVLQSNMRVRLNWTTISETNNYGFEVQKCSEASETFSTIPNSFVPGHGTTLEPKFYTYVDNQTTAGMWKYRLKQIDLDGTRHYSEPVYVDVLTGISHAGNDIPSTFGLHQNYPNPFNPSTTITYEVPKESRVRLEVFNLLGQNVATIVDAVKPAGTHTVEFSAAGLTSGVYVYRLSSSGFSSTRTMAVVK